MKRRTPEDRERSVRRRGLMNDARRMYEQTQLLADELAAAGEALLAEDSPAARERLRGAIDRLRSLDRY